MLKKIVHTYKVECIKYVLGIRFYTSGCIEFGRKQADVGAKVRVPIYDVFFG